MTASAPESPRPADWEAFYRDYRKPGYVSGFEITSKLGGGMFGLVFRARRMSIGKDYAIKFLQVDDGEVRKAVLSELAQVQYFAQIDHPNLVSIEDRGEVDGIPYLVMAFAGTETLRDKIPAGRIPTPAEKDELLRWFLQCCRGLVALHERALVHFDIKPANVFLKGSVARLGDYGLSKLVTHSRGSLSMGRGTPYYMAPEMLQRRGDHRSDIYSLGVLLYEILCGRVPFTGDSEWEVLRQHETKAPELPPHLSERERVVLQRCLAKDPAARFQSVQDLLVVYGVPAGAGAAAWQDLHEPSSGVSASRSSPPVSASAPSADQEDPFVGLGRVARDAVRHAKTIANKAATDAGRAVQEAAAQLGQAAQRVTKDGPGMLRSAVERARSYGARRLGALKRLRRRHGEEQQERVLAVAAAAIRGGRAKPGWLRALLWFGALLFAALLAIAILFAARDGRPSPRRVAAAVGKPVSDTVVVPRAFTEWVSTSEPKWVGLLERDRVRAKADLLQRIEALRQIAPLEPHQRAAADALPRFDFQRTVASARPRLQGDVELLLAGRRPDPAASKRLLAAAPDSLVYVANELAGNRWQTAADRERGLRLQQFLVEATGCRDIELSSERDLPPEVLAAQNRPVGTLWLWFVNEFARDRRTWTAFRTLLPPR